jgi:O-methyltransferase
MMRPESLINDQQLEAMAEMAAGCPRGCFVEVGVYKGGSAWFLAEVARRQGRELHLFDTFLGIPVRDAGDEHQIGDFGDASLDAVRRAIPDAFFHVGMFPDTIPPDLGEIALVHCDCDQQRSVTAVLEHLWPRLVPGGVMVFDDMNQRACRLLLEERFGSTLTDDRVWYVRKPFDLSA